MAEGIHWWTERSLRCRTIYLSLHPLVCRSAYLFIYPCIYPSVYPAILLVVRLFFHLSTYPSICFSIHLFSCLFVFASVYASKCLSMCLSVYLSFWLFLAFAMYPFVFPSSFSFRFRWLSYPWKPEAFHPSIYLIAICRQNKQREQNHVPALLLSSGNQLPDLQTSLMNMSLVLRLPHEMHLCRSSSNVALLQNPHVLLTFPCACHENPHLNRRALFRHRNFQSGLRMVCFVHFDLEMCFAPQWGALFLHVNFQKWSEHVVFLPFWLGNVLGATTACNFSSLIWPAGSSPAALARLLFDPPEPQIIGKTQWIATFLPFRAHASSCFSLCLFSDLLTSWLLLPDSSHLCLSNCPYCRKFDF